MISVERNWEKLPSADLFTAFSLAGVKICLEITVQLTRNDLVLQNIAMFIVWQHIALFVNFATLAYLRLIELKEFVGIPPDQYTGIVA